jgi:thioredoxin
LTVSKKYIKIIIVVITTNRRFKMAKNITNANFNLIQNSEKLCVIDFWAPWCGPCRMLAPTIEELSASSPADIYKCNVDEESALAVKFGISVIPTLIFIKGGAEVHRTQGVLSKAELEALIERFL